MATSEAETSASLEAENPQTLPFLRFTRGEIERHFDREGDPSDSFVFRKVDEARWRASLGHSRIKTRAAEAKRGQLDISEAFVTGDDALLHAAQVEILNLPRAIVSPYATPHETKISGRPLFICCPVFAPGMIEPSFTSHQSGT